MAIFFLWLRSSFFLMTHLVKVGQDSPHPLYSHLILTTPLIVCQLCSVVQPQRQHTRHRLVDVLVTMSQWLTKVLNYLEDELSTIYHRYDNVHYSTIATHQWLFWTYCTGWTPENAPYLGAGAPYPIAHSHDIKSQGACKIKIAPNCFLISSPFFSVAKSVISLWIYLTLFSLVFLFLSVLSSSIILTLFSLFSVFCC